MEILDKPSLTNKMVEVLDRATYGLHSNIKSPRHTNITTCGHCTKLSKITSLILVALNAGQ